jgi:AAA+ superfamily predicted ATPase
LIRFLGNELRIPIVGVGTREAYMAIRSDPQLENRFEPMPLPVWEEGEELLKLLSSFCSMMPLRSQSSIATEEMSKYLLARTDRTIGEIAKLLTAATLVAIETGEEAINQKTLAQADYKSPNERRQTFECVL